MDCSCGKHHLQGVWGQPAHPAGGAGGSARPHPRIHVAHHVRQCA